MQYQLSKDEGGGQLIHANPDAQFIRWQTNFSGDDGIVSGSRRYDAERNG